MTQECKTVQTDVTDLSQLIEMAKAELAGGRANYIVIDSDDPQRQKILMWIIDHSPKWRSDGSAEILKEMEELGY